MVAVIDRQTNLTGNKGLLQNRVKAIKVYCRIGLISQGIKVYCRISQGIKVYCRIGLSIK